MGAVSDAVSSLRITVRNSTSHLANAVDTLYIVDTRVDLYLGGFYVQYHRSIGRRFAS